MTYRRCRCPVWCFGSQNGKRIRKALDTTSWERGEEIIRALDPEESPEKISVSVACDRFIEDCKGRKLADETIGKYELLGRELKAKFASRDIKGISADDLAGYREGWKLSAVSSRKKLERLRSFFRFAVDRGWRRGNPALTLKAPIGRPLPTLPFTDAEMEKILWATEVYPNKGIYRFESGKRIRVFVDLLRYSGLRIRDAATLAKEKLHKGKLLLYTQKTGQPVWLPLPKKLVEDLESVNPAGKHFFWSGNGLAKSTVADWQRSLAKVFKLAGIDGHAHRFRDTFSVNLLQAGVALETVSILLGHSSIKVTEKHYSPWVKSRQIKLEESIEKAWKLG
jgi:integrase/recombinase XerD